MENTSIDITESTGNVFQDLGFEDPIAALEAARIKYYNKFPEERKKDNG